MIELLMTMDAWQWLTLAGILLLGELFIPTGFFVGMAAAALSVGLSLFAFDYDWKMQLTLFAALSVAFTFLYWKFLKPFNQTQEDHNSLNDRSSHQLGKVAVIVEDPESHIQKAQLGDTLWTFSCESPVQNGDKVRVMSAQGMDLFVEII